MCVTSLEAAISDVVDSVPDIVAAGFVDVATGMALNIKTVDSHPEEFIDLMAAATGDLFEGRNMAVIEKVSRQISDFLGNKEKTLIQEVVMFSRSLTHVFIRGKKPYDKVLVVVTGSGASLGMVLNKARRALAPVEAAP